MKKGERPVIKKRECKTKKEAQPATKRAGSA
jgi:hypothetical protein